MALPKNINPRKRGLPPKCTHPRPVLVSRAKTTIISNTANPSNPGAWVTSPETTRAELRSKKIRVRAEKMAQSLLPDGTLVVNLRTHRAIVQSCISILTHTRQPLKPPFAASTVKTPANTGVFGGPLFSSDHGSRSPHLEGVGGDGRWLGTVHWLPGVLGGGAPSKTRDPLRRGACGLDDKQLPDLMQIDLNRRPHGTIQAKVPTAQPYKHAEPLLPFVGGRVTDSSTLLPESADRNTRKIITDGVTGGVEIHQARDGGWLSDSDSQGQITNKPVEKVEVVSARKRLVWGSGTTLIGDAPTKEQLLEEQPSDAESLVNLDGDLPEPTIRTRAAVSPLDGHTRIKQLPTRPGQPGSPRLKRVTMWMRKWVLIEGVKLTRFEKLPQAVESITNKRLRLSLLKARVRVRLVHMNILLLDKYRALLHQPVVVRTWLRANANQLRNNPTSTAGSGLSPRAESMRKRILKSAPHSYVLWWKYRGTLTPRSEELARYVTHFAPHTKYHVPQLGFRGRGVLSSTGERPFGPYGPKQYINEGLTTPPDQLSEEILQTLEQDTHPSEGLGAEDPNTPVQEETFGGASYGGGYKNTPLALPFASEPLLNFLREGVVQQNLSDIQALVCAVYWNTVVGLLVTNPAMVTAKCGETCLAGTWREWTTQSHHQTHNPRITTQTPSNLIVTLVKPRVHNLRYNHTKPFLWLGGGMLIRDLEHYLGTSIYLILEHLNIQQESANFYILRYCFFIKFTGAGRLFVLPLHEAYLALYYAGVCHDLDLACQFFQEVLCGSYYAHAPKLFTIYAQMLCYMWPVYVRYGAGVGLFFELKGKFHRYMTIESQSKRVRLGKTSHSTTNYSLAFRYRQGVNETGAFGIHMHLLAKNEIKDFSRSL